MDAIFSYHLFYFTSYFMLSLSWSVVVSVISSFALDIISNTVFISCNLILNSNSL